MKINYKKNLILIFGFLIIYSCNSEDDECNFIPAITAITSSSNPCSSTGTVKVVSPFDTRFMYKLDQGNFQTNTDFINISVGKHLLSIKDNNGCVVTKEISIDSIKKSILFTEVEAILKMRCSSCHSGLNPHAGIDFTRICDILTNWNRIQSRAIEGNPTPMPQTGLISLVERNKIQQWINNGHKYEE
jgi:hypothetical protein